MHTSQGASRRPARFDGGAVVQLVGGPIGSGGDDVVTLVPASIHVSDRGVTAVTATAEWTWLATEISDVSHSPSASWSILAVPGVPDHGVAVAAGDVAAFRAALDDHLGIPQDGAAEELPSLGRVNGPPAARPTSPPRSTPSFISVAGDRLPAEPIDERDAAGDHQAAGQAGTSMPPRDWASPASDDGDVLDLSDGDAPLPFDDPLPTQVVAVVPGQSLATLEARDVSAWFGSHHVLDRVSLTMQAGEVTALIGPSGCGKSTFLRILNRMHEMIPSAALAGEVHLDGADIYDPRRKLTDARRHIGMVFQKPNPFPAMSIYDNVTASFQLTGTTIGASEKDEVVETCLTKAGLWTEVRDRLRQPGGGLSGGQQQRLCIARALAIRPRVLLMDEPCSALDPTSTRRIEETIVELRSEVTIVIVTHNMQQANRVSDRCAFFLAEAGTPGVIVEHGPTEAMFSSPQDDRTMAYVTGQFG